MGEKTLNIRIKNKYDTEANWTKNDPVLLAGETAYSSDKSGKYKIGDGTHKWSELSYAKADLVKNDVTTALGYTPPTSNTWRGIQNNLTSDSTTDSLSAAQGKALKTLVDGKLSLAGGTMTGPVKWNGNDSLPQFSDNPKYLIGIEPFADNGTMKWQRIESVKVGVASSADSANAAPWSGITGKPSTFTPSSHKQAYTASECTSYTADDNTMGITPAAVKKAFGIFDPKAHTHNYAGSSSAGGAATSAISITETSGTTAVPVNAADGKIEFYYNVNNGLTNNMPSTNNANAIFNISRHGGGNYTSQLGFSSDEEIYYRAGTGTTKWKKILTSDNFTSYSVPLTGSTISNPNASNFSISKAMTGNLLFSNTGDTNGYGIGVGGVNGGSDGWMVRGYQTANNKGCLEIAVGDDGDEGIYVRQYTSGQYKLPFMNKAGSASGLAYREIVLMEPSTGNSIFPATVTATTFKGSLSGNASTATALTTSAGSATQPVYFSGGKPVACTYTLAKSVPADAKFTDTNTWRGVQNNLTSTATDQSLAAAQGKVLNEAKMGAVSANGYYGMACPDGNTSDWIRTTTNGIIPTQSGSRGSGHSGLGTSSWYFSSSYIDHMYSTDVKIADKVQLQYDSTNACLNFVFS